ncbi:hypothetical protein BC939DRAFT_478236 [Gamsiella multidivaricata]|uniref:uncharacterized protein n=1 Tax=Gamsiella multidivaricata TaxID=101098 RepID=UPI002220AE81|nr:uncharacterized protein BC939DRAFT_478236 [Gamsiella multidivaricata]KAI7821515.1 hypothetical protein BC939DRAFT_478236 [Gamsiella multidivaricata]
MPKRPSTPAADQARLPQKSQRTNDGGADTDIGSHAEDSGSNSSVEDMNTFWGDMNDPDTLLKTKLALAIFSDRPLKHETYAVEYLASMRPLSAPTPKADEYLTYLQAVYPAAPVKGMARAWSKMKQYFGDTKKADHSAIENLIDVTSLIAAFKEAPEIATSDSTTSTATAMPPPPSPLMAMPKAATSSSRSSMASSWSRFNNVSNSSSNGSGSGSGSSSNGSGGGCGSSSGNPTPGQILTMKSLFKENFNKFRGGAWSLPSGAVLDERLRGVIECLPYESALHSFVIEDVDALLQLFEDTTDQKEIERIMVTRKDEGLPVLSPAEHNFLQQYDMLPVDLDEFLATHGWRNVGDALQNKPSEEFQKVAHDSITHVLRMYQESDLAFPKGPAEAWFNIHLWGYLRLALSRSRSLEYRPGEVSSDASANRRNKRRTRDGRQYAGHKVDGLVVVSARSLEICHMEAAKKDGGANTTKCLDDTKKLLKLMKDAHDMIREKATQDIRDRLVTFGLRISGPTATIFTLRQRPGRFYQAVAEATMSFPSIWPDGDTGTIIAVISRILMLRKAILAMAASVATWTSLAIDGQNPGGHGDWIAPTMTSPQLLPTTPIIPTEDIPPLNL